MTLFCTSIPYVSFRFNMYHCDPLFSFVSVLLRRDVPSVLLVGESVYKARSEILFRVL